MQIVNWLDYAFLGVLCLFLLGLNILAFICGKPTEKDSSDENCTIITRNTDFIVRS